MNKNIQKAFADGKAFIPFITCGDPSLDVTEQLVYKMEKVGADLIELGIPFSDPTAEGPVIQEANIRALSGGVTTDKIFDMVEKIRKNTQVPMVFMTYANVVFSYGTERFAKKAKEAEGFVYCVSSLGVTGMRSEITTDIGAMVELVKKQKEIPCAVGFGISGPEQAKKMAAQSDGVIVGSAIVKLCEKYGKDCVPHVAAFVKEMKDAIRGL